MGGASKSFLRFRENTSIASFSAVAVKLTLIERKENDEVNSKTPKLNLQKTKMIENSFLNKYFKGMHLKGT